MRLRNLVLGLTGVERPLLSAKVAVMRNSIRRGPMVSLQVLSNHGATFSRRGECNRAARRMSGRGECVLWRTVKPNRIRRSSCRAKRLRVAGPAAPCLRNISAVPAEKSSPRSQSTYFTFFGLPRELNVDVGLLEKEFYQPQPQAATRIFTPERTSVSRNGAWNRVSQLNDAYRTLKDPIKRTSTCWA